MRSLGSAAAANKGFAKYGRQNIALKTLVILIGFCNLAVVIKSYGQASSGNSNSRTSQSPERWLPLQETLMFDF